MKKITLLLIFFMSFFRSVGCSDYYGDGAYFYSILAQTNISFELYYPFLRDDGRKFYCTDPYHHESGRQGNIELWNDLLHGWNRNQIDSAVYGFETFEWQTTLTSLEKETEKYLKYANEVSKAYEYRHNIRSWNYDDIIAQVDVDEASLIDKAWEAINEEQNEQLKARYYYQLIRILHYSQNWKKAVEVYENHIENSLEVNEIYYYILDQVAGCYYSLEQYDKAAGLFAVVVNHSKDRKKSAYVSYGFCVNQGSDGSGTYNLDNEQVKDILFLKSQRVFSDDIDNIISFIDLDPSDARIEVLMARSINNIEREAWRIHFGADDHPHPNIENPLRVNILANIAKSQINNAEVLNKDFWGLCYSYLSFLGGDHEKAGAALQSVNTFDDQIVRLEYLYEVFQWEMIDREKELFLSEFFQKEEQVQPRSYSDSPLMDEYCEKAEYDFYDLIWERVGHLYYKNGELAKAYLVHNGLRGIENLGSLELLEALEEFALSEEYDSFEEILIRESYGNVGFLDYVYLQKGIYYLLEADPQQALVYFEKSQISDPYGAIDGAIFSNNVIECFQCEVEDVMDDEVYKAGVFSFIPDSMNRKELAKVLVDLDSIKRNSTDWKAKLANYLLGNYHFNLSNTGYFRGELTDRPGLESRFFPSWQSISGSDFIAQRKGYHLASIAGYHVNYYQLSKISKDYYQKTLDLSEDMELNARCLYMMAKCDLNTFYNEGSDRVVKWKQPNFTIEFPESDSYIKLHEEYSNTEFHDMIIDQCSYFRYYSSIH